MTDPQNTKIDFAIVTALFIERLAVCKSFGLSDTNKVTVNGHPYWQGELDLNNGATYQIVVVQLPDMANVDAALEVNNVIHDWKPAAILLVGIAGATNRDIRSGDVIIGQEVYYYERGKATSHGRSPEPKRIPADATLYRNAITTSQWKTKIKARRPDGTKQRPLVRSGVVASGEMVVANKRVRNEIVATDRKVIAIEMEGYGFSKAAWQSNIHCPHLVIKAISDAADSKKNDEWQYYAAASAASFTKHYLEECPLRPKTLVDETKPPPFYIAEIEFILDQPMQRFDPNEFMAAAKNVFGVDISQVRISSIRSGSTIVTLEGNNDELAKLIAALKESDDALQLFRQSTGFMSCFYKTTLNRLPRDLLPASSPRKSPSEKDSNSGGILSIEIFHRELFGNDYYRTHMQDIEKLLGLIKPIIFAPEFDWTDWASENNETNSKKNRNPSAIPFKINSKAIMEYLGEQASIIREWPELQALLLKTLSDGGQAWRLPYLIFKAVGGNADQILPAIASMACLQLSIILIDDILDSDPRGEYQRIGTAKTSSLAIALQALGIQVLNGIPIDIRPTITNSFNSMMLHIALGQNLDMENPLNEAAYWKIIDLKSASFYSTAFEVGAILGGASKDTAEQFKHIGHLYGEMIQISDDFSDAMSSPANSDWANGRSTLPILYAKTVEHPDRAKFIELLQSVSDQKALHEAQRILVRCGALSYAAYQLNIRNQQALKSLGKISMKDSSDIHQLFEKLIGPIQHYVIKLHKQSR